MKHGMWTMAGMAVAVLLAGQVRANNVTLVPSDVPDESTPRVAPNAPSGFGADSWMNAAHSAGSNNKVNAYVTPDQLFGHSIQIRDIASISYWTKAPAGQENWFINIYTDGPGDASWYGERFFNSDYTGYTSDGTWHNNGVGSLQRSSGGTFAAQTFSAWQSSYGTETVQFFSPQTNSGLDGNDAQIDGLVVTLKNDEVGSVNFAGAPVPVPAAVWGGMMLLGGLGGFGGLKRLRRKLA